MAGAALSGEQVPAGASDAAQLIQAAGLGLPCLAKPLAACGVPEAHRMVVVTQPAGLHPSRAWGTPHVVQAWVPHTGCLHKVYVLGSKVLCPRWRAAGRLFCLTLAECGLLCR